MRKIKEFLNPQSLKITYLNNQVNVLNYDDIVLLTDDKIILKKDQKIIRL